MAGGLWKPARLWYMSIPGGGATLSSCLKLNSHQGIDPFSSPSTSLLPPITITTSTHKDYHHCCHRLHCHHPSSRHHPQHLHYRHSCSCNCHHNSLAHTVIISNTSSIIVNLFFLCLFALHVFCFCFGLQADKLIMYYYKNHHCPCIIVIVVFPYLFLGSTSVLPIFGIRVSVPDLRCRSAVFHQGMLPSTTRISWTRISHRPTSGATQRGGGEAVQKSSLDGIDKLYDFWKSFSIGEKIEKSSFYPKVSI